MSRFLVPVGSSAALMGAAVLLPVLLDTVERGGPTGLGIGVAAAGCSLVVCGLTALAVGIRRRCATGMPSGARIAVAANILFLAFFALEFSDLLVRQDGKIIYWTNFLFLPALFLFMGLLAARHWAWWISRGIAALGVLWFLGFVFLIPFGNIQRDGVPAPWEARVYMMCVSVLFASVLASAFWSIGRPATRSYFGLIPTTDNAVAEQPHEP